MRVVPVHDELIRLGFVKYREGMEAAGHARLFPEAKRNSRGQMIAELSREFGRDHGQQPWYRPVLDKQCRNPVPAGAGG